MTDRAIRRVAWLVAILSMAMAVAGIAIGSVAHSPSLGGFGLSTAIWGALFPLCGAVVLTRRPRNVIGWLVCFVGFWQALEPFSGVYAIQALISSPGALPLGTFMAWLSVWTWAPGLGAADALGGTLQIASNPGNGTTLRATVPLAAVAAVGG